jgi:hypothetical protein
MDADPYQVDQGGIGRAEAWPGYPFIRIHLRLENGGWRYYLSHSRQLDNLTNPPNPLEMKCRHLPLIPASILMLTQCGPQSMFNPAREVSVKDIHPVAKSEAAFVNDPAGSRLDYRDNHGEYTYRLSKTHLYQFASLTKNRKQSDTRTGVWIYKKTGAKTGQLILDGNDIWNLRFITKNRAMAKNEGDVRTYYFDFEWE